MDNLEHSSERFLSRATSPAWQDQLRANVRLLLSQGADPALAEELDALLQYSEQQLLDYLLAGAVPSPAARERAQRFLDRAQHQLLGSELDVHLLLQELRDKGQEEADASATT